MLAFLCFLLVCSCGVAEESSLELFPASDSTYSCYRIPALVTLKSDVLVAFAEGRRGSCSDFGHVDILMRRSTDKGKTWAASKIVASYGDLQAGNPVPVEDTMDRRFSKGRLFLFYNTGTGPESAVRVGKAMREQWYIASKDGGETWSKPVNITDETAELSAPPYRNPADWRFLAMGPGHGLQTSTGRIFIPGNHSSGDPKPDASDYCAYGFYTDDHGKSFHRTKDTGYPGSNESSAAELSNGWIMMNSRDQSGKTRARIVSISKNNGSSFDTVSVDTTLVDPVVEGSLLSATIDGRHYLFFSNPANAHTRSQLTLRVSTDDGKTWEHSRLITDGRAAYSDLSLIDKDMIGIVYEQAGIQFMTVPLSSLIR